jgi:hypothetical protein
MSKIFVSRRITNLSDKGKTDSLVGEVSIAGLKLNQLMLAPQLSGQLSISRESIKVCEEISTPMQVICKN